MIGDEGRSDFPPTTELPDEAARQGYDRLLGGVAWLTANGGFQIGLSVLSFGFATSRLGPAAVGSYGAAMLAVSTAQTLLGGALTDSLQQRAVLEPRHADATFWTGLGMSAIFALVLAMAAVPLAIGIGVPEASHLLGWLAIGVPLSSLEQVPRALLWRRQRFAATARVGATASLVSSLVTIATVASGSGAIGLVAADLSSRVVSVASIWWLAGYRPKRRIDLRPMADLARFNLGSSALYLLGFADRMAPQALTAIYLGAEQLGYLMAAQRVLDLLTQLVLAPIASVAMTAVARLQHERTELHKLVRKLYRTAAFIAYPAFLGAMAVTPDLARLIGPRWIEATVTTQILLLVGLRTTTGIFNIPVLRGLGRNVEPLILVGLGLGLQLLLAPTAARHGAAGIAAAVLLRTVLTWPLGCWLLKSATGISIRTQLAEFYPAGVAALVMAACVMLLGSQLSLFAPSLRLVIMVAAGGAIYTAAVLSLSGAARRNLSNLLHRLRAAQRRHGLDSSTAQDAQPSAAIL